MGVVVFRIDKLFAFNFLGVEKEEEEQPAEGDSKGFERGTAKVGSS